MGCEGSLNSSWALGVHPEGNGEPLILAGSVSRKGIRAPVGRKPWSLGWGASDTRGREVGFKATV